jgi:hypothetical protein
LTSDRFLFLVIVRNGKIFVQYSQGGKAQSAERSQEPGVRRQESEERGHRVQTNEYRTAEQGISNIEVITSSPKTWIPE